MPSTSLTRISVRTKPSVSSRISLRSSRNQHRQRRANWNTSTRCARSPLQESLSNTCASRQRLSLKQREISLSLTAVSRSSAPFWSSLEDSTHVSLFKTSPTTMMKRQSRLLTIRCTSSWTNNKLRTSTSTSTDQKETLPEESSSEIGSGTRLLFSEPRRFVLLESTSCLKMKK